MIMKENKIFSNAKWIILCRIAQSLFQLIIGMLTARFLGPSNYGLINYATSVVAFVVPVTQLGLNATLVRELIDSPEKEGEIMGTSLLMSVVAGFMGMVLVAGFVSAANPAEPLTITVCILHSISLVFRALELIQYWFHSKLQSKFPSMMMLCAYVIVSAYKIFLLISGKGVCWFVLVYSLEYAIIAFSLLVIYRYQALQKLSFSISMAKRLFSKSRYYILSSLSLTLFQNTDHIMLKTMYGDVENGLYSAAIACTGICQFVYSAIIDSARPVILASKRADSFIYEKNISQLYCIITYLAFAQGVCYTAFAPLIIKILYGEEYILAVSTLRILVWYVAFSQMGGIRNIWILAEEKQKILWKINLMGALMNIVVNACLIPFWGAAGAAFASLSTQIFTNFVLGFLLRPIRYNNQLLLKGMDPRLLMGMLLQTIVKKGKINE